MPLGSDTGVNARSAANAMMPLDFWRTGVAVTLTLTVAELFELSGSGSDELTEAVLLMTEPSLAEPLTPTVRRMASDAPTASDGKRTLTLLPLPPQTPLPVAVHLI